MKSAKKPLSKNIGPYLRQIRENTEFSQAWVAEKLGLKRQELNYYEQGTRIPSEGLLVRLAHLYRVPTGEVLERAYWPQLVLLPLIAIVEPEKLSREMIDELEKGLKEEERKEMTSFVERLLQRRTIVKR
jgi:transcriptional regulator with XRE-family HTH domain